VDFPHNSGHSQVIIFLKEESMSNPRYSDEFKEEVAG
jgi:hypothetical protein